MVSERVDLLGGVSSDEVAKYQRCYRLPEYKMGPRRLVHAAAQIDRMIPGASYLDVGCGRAETVAYAQKRGINAIGLDFVPELCDGVNVLCGYMTALPFDDKQFEYVSCYDAVEHLPPHQVDVALDELFRVAGNELFISTNNQASNLEDLTLHLSRNPRVWWEDKLIPRALKRGWVVEFVGFADPARDWSWRIC